MTSARARVYLVGTPTKFDQGAESPQTAFELTSRAPPQSFAKAGPEYGATVGATVRFQRNYDGKQPGDDAAEKHAIQVLASDREWKDLSISADYGLPDVM